MNSWSATNLAVEIGDGNTERIAALPSPSGLPMALMLPEIGGFELAEALRADPRMGHVPIIALIPLALRGVAYRPVGAGAMLRRNLLIYGVGGIIIPFAGIKLIDVLINAAHLV